MQQASSSPSSSLVVLDGCTDDLNYAKLTAKPVTVMEESEDEEHHTADHDDAHLSMSTVKLRRHSGSNGSSAGSPLTPSTDGSGPEEPQHQRGSTETTGALLSSTADLAARGVAATAVATAVTPSALTTSIKPDGPFSASSSSVTGSHTIRVDARAADATPRRMPHTLQVQPPSRIGLSPPPPQPKAQERQQHADGAPPTKRLRLSLTGPTAAATAVSPVAFSSGKEAAPAPVSDNAGRGRMLRLVPHTTTEPSAVASHALDTETRGVSPLDEVEVKKEEAPMLRNEKEAQALRLTTAHTRQSSSSTFAVGNAALSPVHSGEIAIHHQDSLPLCAAATNTAEAPALLPKAAPTAVSRPPPIATNTSSVQGGDVMGGPSSAALAAEARQATWQQQPASASCVTTAATASFPTTAGSLAGTKAVTATGNNNDSGHHAFLRLRPLTPQPPCGTATTTPLQGSPRRRHRFVSVNLPSVPPPPQSELFSTFQRTVRDVYDVHEKLSEGTYGEVFKGVDKRTGAVVALKRLKTLSTHQGFPQTSLREVIALRHIQNQRERLEARQQQQQQQRHGSSANGTKTAAVPDPLAEIAQLCDVLVFDRQQPDIVLVFAYATASLAGLLRRQFVFSPAELAYVIKKLLIAVRKLHEMSIIHRDIKSDNVLITGDGEVQLTDFGLCSIVSSGGGGGGGASTTASATLSSGHVWRTPSVITLAYRPPEMLLGSTAYDEKVDVWSVGCLLAQLFLFEPPFYRHRALQQQQGQQQQQQHPQRTAATELEQLSRITEVLGPLPPARVYHPSACQHMRVVEQLEEQGRLAESGKAAQPANWGRLQSLFVPSFLYQQFHGFRGWFEAEVQRSRHQPPRRPTQACMDVLCAALQLDPQQRPSAAELLRMPYFTTLDDAPLLGGYQRPLPISPEREDEVRRGFMLKVLRCGDSHTQRRPH